MIDFHHLLVTVGAFLVLIGLMVVVHEFGHFAVAKLCKVRVEAFSFGFGPRLFGFKYGDTDYKVCLLPLGGFVKMTGESSEQNLEAPGTEVPVEPPAYDPGSFTSHPRWQRMLIGVAGPSANFVLAFVLMLFYFNFINEVPSVNPIAVEWVTAGSAAAQAGIEPNDIIRRFGTTDNPSWEQIRKIVGASSDQTIPVTVQRGGQSLPLSLHVSGGTKGKQLDMSQSGLFLHLVQSPLKVDSVAANTPADRAGLRPGDEILAVDGHAFHTTDPMLAYLQAGKGKPVTLTISRNGQVISPIAIQPSIQDSAWRLGFMPDQPKEISTHPEPLGISESTDEARDFCVENSTMILDVLGRILRHRVSVSQLSGPVGIAQMAGQAAEMKEWYPKFGLAAGISLNLGIVNLLPFPILDGGMIFLLMIESSIRRDISSILKERIYQAAFVLIIAFFAFIIFNDVTKLPFFTHLKP